MADGTPTRGRTVNQEHFERAHEGEWREFEALLAQRGGEAADFPARYRRICRDLALAEDRGFAASLVDRLNDLALRGHQRLYGARGRAVHPLEFLAARFPAALRREWRLFLAASLVFYGLGGAIFAAVLRQPEFVHHLMPPDQVQMFESMYDPDAEHYGTPRDTVGDLDAFAFYTRNNIGVALRTFAWGIFAGLGSLFLLAFNAITISAVAAHLTVAGQAEPFFSFVIGHGAFELTAIVMAGAAGMRLGWSLVAPGRRSRAAALREAGAACLPLLYAIIAMLLVAAVLEAFWSSSRWVSPGTKFAVGGALWLFVALWLAFGGRRRAHR